MDNLCAEVLDGDKLVKYIAARREAFDNLVVAKTKYFDEDEREGILTFGDFYYKYLEKYSISFSYNFNSRGYTKKFKELLQKNNINPKELNINWVDIENKENEYQEVLVDILYSIISYELKKIDKAIFGINIGYESVLYFVTSQKSYERIVESQKLLKIFDVPLLESIYGEIFEITGELDESIPFINKGDFIEKKDNKYYSLFRDEDKNIVISDIDEYDEKQVKIIL